MKHKFHTSEQTVKKLKEADATITPGNTILFGVSGGDCPGLNSALASVVKRAKRAGLAVYAFINGLEALCTDHSNFLDRIIRVTPQLAKSVDEWGSILSGSSRTSLTNKEEQKQAKKQANAVANCKNFRGVVMIGGDDHAKQAGILAELLKPNNVPVAIIPKSIDFDCHTLMLGPSTAIFRYLEGFYSTALSAKTHIRCNVYEFMGRTRSWLTVLGSYGYPEIFAPESLPQDYSIKHMYPFAKLPKGLKNSIAQTQGSIIRLIAERPVCLKDILLNSLKVMLEKELTVEGYNLVNGRGQALEPLPRFYVNIAVSEGFTFQDTLVEANRQNKDTLFYRLLNLSKKLTADFESEIKKDEHGNPKFSGIGQYLQFALTHLPELAEQDKDLKPLYQRLEQEAKACGKDSIFKEEDGKIILNGPRYTLPGFESRGLQPNQIDKLLGHKFGTKAVELILANETGLEVCMDRYADVETTEPDAKPVAHVAIKEAVVNIFKSDGTLEVQGVHTEEELTAAGVLLA